MTYTSPGAIEALAQIHSSTRKHPDQLVRWLPRIGVAVQADGSVSGVEIPGTCCCLTLQHIH